MHMSHLDSFSREKRLEFRYSNFKHLNLLFEKKKKIIQIL